MSGAPVEIGHSRQTHGPQDGTLLWRRCAIGAAGAMFVGMGLGRFSYSAMVPALVHAGALDAVEAGRVGMSNLGGFLVGASVSVWLARRLGRRRTVLCALGVCLALLALSALPWGGLWLALCRGGIGIATGMMMVLSLAVVTETAPSGQRPVAAGFMFAGVGLGILASALLVPALYEAALWEQWGVLAVAGAVGASVAAWGWWRAPEPPGDAARNARDGMAADGDARRQVIATVGLTGLFAAHLLFSLGLVPHTLYWVDFLRRSVGATAGEVALNWGLVGLFSFLGPLLAAELARRLGTARALVASFVVIGLGLALPMLVEMGAAVMLAGWLLLSSSVLFGAQPGLSSLMAARTRDLGDPAAMDRIMRAMILANAAGGLLGGVAVPWLHGLGWSQPALFVSGGGAMLLAGVAAATGAAAGREASTARI